MWPVHCHYFVYFVIFLALGFLRSGAVFLVGMERFSRPPITKPGAERPATTATVTATHIPAGTQRAPVAAQPSPSTTPIPIQPTSPTHSYFCFTQSMPKAPPNVVVPCLPKCRTSAVKYADTAVLSPGVSVVPSSVTGSTSNNCDMIVARGGHDPEFVCVCLISSILFDSLFLSIFLSAD